MLINKCDVCGVDKEYMEPFIIPMFSFKREDSINGCKWEKKYFQSMFISAQFVKRKLLTISKASEQPLTLIKYREYKPRVVVIDN